MGLHHQHASRATGIVVEGGAMRGVFAAGVLDELFDAQLTDVELAVGTSAGACNLASFVAHQPERNLRCYLDLMCGPEFFNLRRALRGGNYMDLDWLWAQLAERFPLDHGRISRSTTRLVATATCVQTGAAHYVTLKERSHEDLKASCALPVLYRSPVTCDDKLLVDGGIADPIPAEFAYTAGIRRMVVIRSRPAGACKSTSVLDWMGRRMLKRAYPELARAVASVPAVYRRTINFLEKPPADLRVIQIAPPQRLKTTRATTNRVTLRADYDLGRSVARYHLDAVRDLLTVSPGHVA